MAVEIVYRRQTTHMRNHEGEYTLKSKQGWLFRINIYSIVEFENFYEMSLDYNHTQFSVAK